MNNFAINQIKIMIDVSDPDKSGKPFPFTKGRIYHPTVQSSDIAKYSEYPFFTPDVRYPKAILNKLSYERRLRFFFIKDRFKKTILQNMGSGPGPGPGTGPSSESGSVSESVSESGSESGSESKNTDIITYNIETMIELLFPTVYPIVNNYSNSFERYINQKSNFDFTFKGAIPSTIAQIAPGLNLYYSYLKSEGGDIYTITKLVWLNDIINNPVYRELIDAFNEFTIWKTNQSTKIIDDIKRREDKIMVTLKTAPVNTDDESNPMFKYIKSIIKQKVEGTTGEIISRQLERNQFIDLLIAKIEELFKGDSKIEVILENAEEIRTRLQDKRFNIIIPQGLKLKINRILEESKNINNLIIINDKYFKDEINIRFEEDDADVKTYFNTNFKKYVDFVEKIKEYIKPKRESTNGELQTMIYDYTQGTSSDFFAFLKYVNGHYLQNNNGPTESKYTPLMYVGINTTEEGSKDVPKYETYLQADVIGGELNNSNNGLINCNYKGEFIGELFQKYRRQKSYNPFEVAKKRLFFDIKEHGPEAQNKKYADELNTIQQLKKQNGVSNQNPSPPNRGLGGIQPNNVGGRRTVKIRRNKKPMTRKNRK